MSPVIADEKLEQDAAAPHAAPVASEEQVSVRAVKSMAERAAGAVIADVITSPESLPFDRVSRQRLLVAQSAADTLERLSESGAWERLEPSLAGHLVGQARRLSAYVTGLSQARPVRASEPALLLLRRLERRLEIAAELAEGDDGNAAGGAGGGLFLGDFTESEVAGDEATQPRRKGAGQPKAGRQATSAKVELKRRWASKAERIAALRTSRRVMTYIGAAALAVMASGIYRMLTTVQERTVAHTAPPVQFTPGVYLSDVQIFLPATSTAQLGLDMTVVVSKEWLRRPYERRVEDAGGASVFLLNRNVRKVRFQWEDGIPIVQFNQGVAHWFTASELPKQE